MFASRPTVNSAAGQSAALLVLPLCFLLSGGAGIVYQIAWARQLAQVFGTTEVAVAVVLASYMGGLALGIAAQPAIMLYGLRVQGALAAQKPEALVESIWAYGHGLFASGPDAPSREATRTTLKQLVQLLDDHKTGADPARVVAVCDGLLNDLRGLAE